MAKTATSKHSARATMSLGLLSFGLLAWFLLDSGSGEPHESTPDSAFDAAEASERSVSIDGVEPAGRVEASSTAIAIRDAETGQPIPGVELLGESGDVFAVTDRLGAFQAGNARQLTASHPDYAVTALSISRTGDIELRRRPRIRCWLEGVDSEDVRRHDFDIEIASARDTELAKLGLADIELGPRVQSWGGHSPVGIDHYDYGPVLMKLTVRKTGTTEVVREQQLPLTLAEPVESCAFVISPPLPQPLRIAEDLSAKLDVTFWFPVDAEISVIIEGPLMHADGPKIRRTGGVVVEGTTNQTLTIPLQNLASAWYRWSVRVHGRGPYRGGSFEVRQDGQELQLQNDKDGFFDATIRFMAPPDQSGTGITWLADGQWQGGTFLEPSSDPGSITEYRAIVQRGRRNWVKAYSRLGNLESRAVEIAPDQPVVTLTAWRPRGEEVSFELDTLLPDKRYWLTATELETGLQRRSTAAPPSSRTQLILSIGAHAVVVHTPGGPVLERTISIPECGSHVPL